MDFWKFRVNGRKIASFAILALAIVLLILLGRAVVGIVQGTLNFTLGIIVLLLLLAIVLWMFAYADRRRRRHRRHHRHRSSSKEKDSQTQ